MRLYARLLCLVLAAPSFAESPMGFVDIAFGAPRIQALEILSARAGLKAVSSTEEQATFSGGTFAGQAASLWTLAFAGGKFASGSVLIDKVTKPVYDELKADLTRKYGKPDSEKGNLSWECLWEFRNNGRRTVRLDYSFAGKVVVTYTHGALVKGVVPEKKPDL